MGHTQAWCLVSDGEKHLRALWDMWLAVPGATGGHQTPFPSSLRHVRGYISQLPEQSCGITGLSSGQWKVGGHDIHHFQAWPPNPPTQPLCMLSFQLDVETPGRMESPRGSSL